MCPIGYRNGSHVLILSTSPPSLLFLPHFSPEAPYCALWQPNSHRRSHWWLPWKPLQSDRCTNSSWFTQVTRTSCTLCRSGSNGPSKKLYPVHSAAAWMVERAALRSRASGTSVAWAILPSQGTAKLGWVRSRHSLLLVSLAPSSPRFLQINSSPVSSRPAPAPSLPAQLQLRLL